MKYIIYVYCKNTGAVLADTINSGESDGGKNEVHAILHNESEL